MRLLAVVCAVAMWLSGAVLGHADGKSTKGDLTPDKVRVDAIVPPKSVSGNLRRPENGESGSGARSPESSYVTQRILENASHQTPDGRTIGYFSPLPGTEDAENGIQRVPLERVLVDPANGSESHLGYDCVLPGAIDDDGGSPVVIQMTQRDFAELPVEALTASAGPLTDWLPVGMPNVLFAEPEEQTLDTSVLGVPIRVRAIPVSYHWDLGDGNTITTEKPGEPYPSEQVSSTYSYEGWYDITLTTTFRGEFSVDGGPWQQIDGTIEVASEPRALFSKSLESRLVNPNVPVDEEEDPWIPPRSEETEGPQDPDARHRTI